ncbi:hypothetical protein LguiB_024077 [Lonicera macranthoides]
MEYSSSLLLSVLLSSVLLCAAVNSLDATTKAFIECLNTHYPQNSKIPISKVTLTPKNSTYTSVLEFSIQDLRFASPSTNKPLVIVTPVNETQIQTVLYCSKKNEIQLRIRCGGHDFEGLSYSTPNDIPFVMIDMINLRSVDVDVESGTAWIGGGASLGEVYYGIGNKSSTYGFPGGVWSTVGIGGFISGGGYGSLKRKYGLGADNVIDVRFMNVNGKILDRESMGEDLFWAIRGGIASNFGVVLAWKVNLVKVPEIVTVFAVHRTLEQNGTELLYKWQSVAPTIDRDLYLRVQFLVVNQDGKRTIRIAFESLFLGGADRLLSVMKESFPELGLVREDCTEVSWIESTLFFAGNGAFSLGTSVEVLLNRSAPPKLYYKAKSDYVQVPIPVEGLEGIWDLFFQLDDGATNILMTPYGGKMDEYSESALPFPHRAGILYMMYTGVTWQADTPVAEQQRRLDFLNSLYSYLGSYVSKNPRQAYVNYNDLDIGVGTSYEEASVWGTRYFKDNFKRLVQVKTAVDPDNFFRHEQSIPIFTAKSDSRAEL